MTRFILFFLIGFLLAQKAFPACISGFNDPLSGTKWQTDCNSNINRTGYVGYCNYSYTHSNGMAVYKDVCIQKTNQTGHFECPDNSMLPEGVSNCKGGNPYEPPEPTPPLECDPGYVDGGGSLGCVFAGCPSGTKQVVHKCVPDTACVTTYCYSQPSEPAICKTVEVDCEETNTQNTTTNEQNGCSVFSPDYMGQDLQNRPRCRSDFPPDTEAPECANYKMGYVNNVQTFTCFDESTTDAPVNVVECGFGYISIDGNCEKTGVANREEKTHVVLNEDGSYSEVTESKDTFYNPDGTITTVEYTKTQKFNSDGTKDGSPEFSQEQKKEEADNRAVAGSACAKPPSCSGNAIGCAAIQQAWFTTCNVEQLKTLTDTKATSQLSAINSTNSKLDTLNNSTSQTNSKFDTANSSLDSIATNTNTTNSKLDSLLDVLNTANNYLNEIAGNPSTGGGGNNNNGGEGGEGQGNGTASGGGTCETAPTCSENADQVQCAILIQNWYLRCDSPSAGKNEGFTYSDAAEGILTAAKESFSDFMDDLKGEIGEYFTFDLTSQEGGIPCNQVEMWGVEVDISWCRFTEQLAWLGYVFIALAYIKALQIILD